MKEYIKQYLFVAGAIFMIAAVFQPQLCAAEKSLTNNDIILLKKAGLGDITIMSLIQKSATKFNTDIESLIKLKKAGIGNELIETIMEKGNNKTSMAPVSASKQSMPQTHSEKYRQEDYGRDVAYNKSRKNGTEKVGGFDVSLFYLSVPIVYNYLEITEQLTLRDDGWGPYVYTVSESEAAKSKSFMQGGIGLRFAKMNNFSDSVSVGIEWGFTLMAGEKTFSYSAEQTVMGTTQTVRYSDRCCFDTYDTKYGPVSIDIKVKSVVLPLLAKVDYKIGGKETGDFFSIGAGLGTYFMLNVREIMEKSWNYSGIPTQEKDTLTSVGMTPAAEISAGGGAKVLDNISFTVSGIIGYSLKEKRLVYEEYSKPGLSYKQGFEIGGLSYGGKIGLSFLF